MLRIALAALLLSACDPALEEAIADGFSSSPSPSMDNDDVLPQVGELLKESYDFAISEGRHRSNHDFVARPHLGTHVDRELSFTVTFGADAAYQTQSAANQSDWNKLMGLTTDRIHQNSVRIGWRWNPRTQLVELGFYGYLDGTREMPMLASVPLGQPIDCVLKMNDQGLFAQAGSATYSQSGSNGVALATTWILHSAYFGGDEKAPHELHVQVTNIVGE
jgi:hypothetical protein